MEHALTPLFLPSQLARVLWHARRAGPPVGRAAGGVLRAPGGPAGRAGAGRGAAAVGGEWVGERGGRGGGGAHAQRAHCAPPPPTHPQVAEGAAHTESAWMARLPCALTFLLQPWWAGVEARHSDALFFTSPRKLRGGEPGVLFVQRAKSHVLGGGAGALRVALGYNNWTVGGAEGEMRDAPQLEGKWQAFPLAVPREAYELQFVLSDGEGAWDNNAGGWGGGWAGGNQPAGRTTCHSPPHPTPPTPTNQQAPTFTRASSAPPPRWPPPRARRSWWPRRAPRPTPPPTTSLRAPPPSSSSPRPRCWWRAPRRACTLTARAAGRWPTTPTSG